MDFNPCGQSKRHRTDCANQNPGEIKSARPSVNLQVFVPEAFPKLKRTQNQGKQSHRNMPDERPLHSPKSAKNFLVKSEVGQGIIEDEFAGEEDQEYPKGQNQPGSGLGRRASQILVHRENEVVFSLD